ncbi:MAG: 16S rRNA (cytosine(1402)-N(4))-methyltransferase RsmH [Phycisphaerales bacterium]
MTPPPAGHIPVLLDDVLDVLAPEPGQVYADATAGLGGHALAVARRLGPTGTVVLNDADPSNLGRASGRLKDELGAACPAVIAIHANFADLPRQLAERNLAANMLLADLGFSSNQVDNAAKGMSFQHDAPLDMRLDPGLPTTAAELVATLPEAELARILFEFGEERQARRIARKLAESRAKEPISTTLQLAQIVRGVLARPGAGGDRIDPATRTFQALRIAVNDELGVLESLLASVRRAASARTDQAGRWLGPGARVAIISFHSLEDRPVKRAFTALCGQGLGEAIGSRLRRADEAELEANPRARSARLRAVRLAGDGGNDVGTGVRAAL